MCSLVDFIFDDKRICVFLLVCWLCTVVTVLFEIGVLNSHFFHFGPSDETIFMGTPINTWYRYSLVAAFTFLNTAVNDFFSDALSPWFLNVVMDFKTKYIPYSKPVCILLIQTYSVYCNLVGVLTIFLSLSQIDFVLIRCLADVGMSIYTNLRFLRNKVHNDVKYKELTSVVSDEQQQLCKTSTESCAA